MSSRFIALGVLLVLLTAPSAKAQVTIDAAKITCIQFATGKIGKLGSLAYWLGGYLNAKRDNTIIDVLTMERNAKKLELYCLKNRDMLVMDAAKTVLGVDK